MYAQFESQTIYCDHISVGWWRVWREGFPLPPEGDQFIIFQQTDILGHFDGDFAYLRGLVQGHSTSYVSLYVCVCLVLRSGLKGLRIAR